MADPNDWLNQEDVSFHDEPETYSFEDSDRFEEDDSCSFNSSSDGLGENFAGWLVENDNALLGIYPTTYENYSPAFRDRMSSMVAVQRPEKTGVQSLSDMASQQCAKSLSFGQMEEVYRDYTVGKDIPENIPENIFSMIQKCCFPKSARDIRLYSCLSNGSSDVYNNGETIYQINGVTNVLQIGFLVTGIVQASTVPDQGNMPLGRRQTIEARNNVSIRVDRCRIIECSCSCKSAYLWCEHAVALSLFRLNNPDSVQYRLTIWESVNELQSDDLKKFAQYLISELPRDYLPVAQGLLDQFRDPNSEINNSIGAPDPTDGGHEDVPLWALEPSQLSARIRSKLIRYCTPAPVVYAPHVDHAGTPSPITREWQSIHNSFCTREPEWIWNLFSIIRELIMRRDGNALRLLQSLTDECFTNSQILIWWYVTNLSHGGMWKQCPSARSVDNNQYSSQLNGANICEELVRLWKLVTLNPALSAESRNELFAFMQMYHEEACQRIWLIIKGKTNVDVNTTLNVALLQNVTDLHGQPLSLNNARFGLDHFPGFYKALQAHLTCSSSDFAVQRSSRAYPALARELAQSSLVPGSMIMLVTPQKKKKSKRKHKKNHRTEPAAPQYAMVRNAQASSAESGQESEQETTNDNRPARPGFPKDDVSSVLAASYVPLDPFEQRVTECEVLETHGYKKQAYQMAKDIMKSLQHQLDDEQREVILFDQPSTSKAAAIPISNDNQNVVTDVEKQIFRMETVVFMSKILSPTHRYDPLIFSTIVKLLESTSLSSPVSYLAIKKFYLESELIKILRNLTLNISELQLLRKATEKISKVISYGGLPSYHLTLFIFQKLPYTGNFVLFDGAGNPNRAGQNTLRRMPEDDDLTLKCALDVLGSRLLLSEDEYPMIAESVRRMKRELAVEMLERHKDSREKLGLIMDKLLDPSIHRMYRYHLSNAAYFLERDNVLMKHTIRGQRPVYPYKPLPPPEVSTINEDLEKATEDMAKLNPGLPSSSKPSYSAQNSVEQDRTPSAYIPTSTKIYPKRKTYQNHSVTDGQAKHYVDLARAILHRAGGTQINHMFTMGHENLGPHRNLHICSLLVSIYALGLKNKQSTNWESRTYNSHVTNISHQVSELGTAAVEILRDTWEGHLTPSETASIADKQSQVADEAVVFESAKLAQSVLPFACRLTTSEVKKAIEQCKDQGNNMLEKACQMVDEAAVENFLDPRVLFTVAHYWGRLDEQPQQHLTFVPPPAPPVVYQQQHHPQMFNPATYHYQQGHIPWPPPSFEQPPPTAPGMYAGPPHGSFMPPAQPLYLGGPAPMPGLVNPGANRLHQSHSAPQLNEAPITIDATGSKLVKAFKTGLKAMENLRNIMNEENNRNKLSQDGAYNMDIDFVKMAAYKLGPTFVVSFYENAIKNVPFYKILHRLGGDAARLPMQYLGTAAYKAYERTSQSPPRQPTTTSGPLFGQVRQSFLAVGHTLITADLFDKCIEQACVLTASKMNFTKFSPDERSQINALVLDVSNIFNEMQQMSVNVYNFYHQYVNFVRRQKGYKALQATLELKKNNYQQNYPQYLPH